MDIEEKARQLGWKPLEEFQGAPEKWRPAEEYVARGEELLPLLRADKRKLEEDLHGVKGELQSTKAALDEAREAIEAFKEFANGAAKKDFDAAVATLQEKVIQARENGDARAEIEAERALAKLGTEAPQVLQKSLTPPPPPPAPQARETPEFTEWKNANADWLEKDKAKTAYAASMAAFVRATTNLEGREFFAKVSELTEERFAPREPVDRTGAPQARGSSGAKSYSNLPPDARAACDRQGAKLVGPGRAYKTDAEWRAAYVARYDWS